MKHGPLLLALGLMLSSGMGHAQDTAPAADDGTTTKFADWTVKCGDITGDGTERCVMGQVIQKQVSDEAAVSIAIEIGYFPGEDTPTMLVTVPLGVPLIPGVRLKIDAGEPIRVPFQICSKQGCLAAFPLEPSLVASMKKGAEAKVAFAVSGKQGLELPVSLSGFTKAHAHFASKSKSSKKSSSK